MSNVNTQGWDDIWLQYHAVNQKKILHWLDIFRFSDVPPCARILDIGCGTGEALTELRRRGYRSLQGMEPEAKLVERDTTSLIRQGDCLTMTETDCHDAVLMFGVLHHLKSFEDIQRCLRNVHRSLVVGGRFYSVEQWKNIIRTVAMVLVRDTPVGLLHPILRVERGLLRLERTELDLWLSIEPWVTRYAESIGLKVIFAKKDVRYRYIIFERVS